MLVKDYRMMIDVHASCLIQSLGEACTIEEIKPKPKKGQPEEKVEEVDPGEKFIKEFNERILEGASQ